MKRAKKVGMTIGEVIDSYLEKYAELPIYKMVHDGSVVKESAETIPLT